MLRTGFILSALVVAGWLIALWADDYTDRHGVTGEQLIYFAWFTFLSLIAVWVAVLSAAMIRFVARANRANRAGSDPDRFVKPS